jgi:BirA family biotin operon repressor/biotin-[acetyl-CoA-carboxylase] ligase
VNIDLPDSMRNGDEPPFRGKIVDLTECTTNPPSRENLSVVVIESLFDCMVRFESDGFAPFLDEWRKYDWLFGKQIVVDQPDRRHFGHADGVDDDGALIIRTDKDRQRVINGSVTIPDDDE